MLLYGHSFIPTYYSFLIDKITNHMASWKWKALSFAKEQFLFNLSSLPCHYTLCQFLVLALNYNFNSNGCLVMGRLLIFLLIHGFLLFFWFEGLLLSIWIIWFLIWRWQFLLPLNSGKALDLVSVKYALPLMENESAKDPFVQNYLRGTPSMPKSAGVKGIVGKIIGAKA